MNKIISFLFFIFLFLACDKKNPTIESTVERIELNESEIELRIGDTYQFKVFHFPENVPVPLYEWEVSKIPGSVNFIEVATIDENGKLTALRTGHAIVKVNTYISTGGKLLNLKSECEIVVSEPSEPLEPLEFFDDDQNCRNYKNSLLEKWRKLVVSNKNMDYSFMKKERIERFEIFYDKTYLPLDSEILSYWSNGYSLLREANILIENFEKRGDLSDFRKYILSQAKVIRAYTHLKLTEWYDRVPLVLKVLSLDDNITQSSRQKLLKAVIDDLDDSISCINPDDDFYISSEKAMEILVEAYLLNKEWSNAIEQVQNISSSLAYFYQRVAEYKLGQIQHITESTLLDEYFSIYFNNIHQGNLILNILDYSADYFGWDEDEKYKAILPIPRSELDKIPGLIQNPGY